LLSNGSLQNGYNIELDHFLLFQAHFELGTLYEKTGDYQNALKHYNIVMDNKPPELNPHRKMVRFPPIPLSFLISPLSIHLA
jgi:tetratricopeptide (TPR) repeat protein